MSEMQKQVEKLKKELTESLEAAMTVQAVDVVRIAFLGKRGSITILLATLKTLSPAHKKEYGPLLNTLKNNAQQAVASRLETVKAREIAQREVKKKHFDVTATSLTAKRGHLHPYTHVIEDIENIFLSMGYELLDGPEVETDYYNFTGLNIPENHPARDMYDTFWLDLPSMLLRTHTSPVQIHAMEHKKPPIAAIAIGRCYRHEATDASHDYMFMQCEGFLISEHVTLAHLFATAKNFLKTLFKKDDITIRTRPGFFPFVEPGVEIDMQCPFCNKGCSVCKKTRWIEVFPGGLIHPNVLKAGGVDPQKYSGFAFGFGLTRLAMLQYKIRDIRLLHGGKLKFLEQF